MSTPDSVAAAVLSVQPTTPVSGGTPNTTTSTVASQVLADLEPGQKVPVFVLASQPNGRFYVQVQDQLLDMNLPPGTQSGQSLELQVVSNGGHLVFSLPSDAITENAQEAVDLSSASRALMQAVGSNTSGSVAQLLGSGEPLTETPLDTSQLASQLQSTVQDSGLFYESRQLQWTQGQVSLQELMQQPQAQFSSNTGSAISAQLISPDEQAQSGTNASASMTQVATALSNMGIALQDIESAFVRLQQTLSDASATATPAMANAPDTATQAQTESAAMTPSLPDFAQMQRLASDTGKNLVASVQSSTSAATAIKIGATENAQQATHVASTADAASTAVTSNNVRLPDVHNLVQQQLNVLENSHLRWQGQVWPGQTMDWDIQADDQGGGAESEQVWSSRLALTLPNLGRVVANMQLLKGQLNVSFLAEQPQTASALVSNQGQLTQQFADASLPLNPISVAVGSDETGSTDEVDSSRTS